MAVSKVPPQDTSVTIKFGGGLNTRASTDEIDAREAADGQNFLLDLSNRELGQDRPLILSGRFRMPALFLVAALCSRQTERSPPSSRGLGRSMSGMAELDLPRLEVAIPRPSCGATGARITGPWMTRYF